MSTFDLLFPSKDQVENCEEVFSNVEYDEVRSVYRPTEEAVQAAWDEIVEVAKELKEEPKVS